MLRRASTPEGFGQCGTSPCGVETTFVDDSDVACRPVWTCRVSITPASWSTFMPEAAERAGPRPGGHEYDPGIDVDQLPASIYITGWDALDARGHGAASTTCTALDHSHRDCWARSTSEERPIVVSMPLTAPHHDEEHADRHWPRRGLPPTQSQLQHAKLSGNDKSCPSQRPATGGVRVPTVRRPGQ